MKLFNIRLMSLALVLLFFIISCSKNEISSDKLQERNGIYYVVNKDKPYSGTVFATYGNEQRRFEKEYKKGELDGLSIEWYSNGQKKSEIFYNDGQKSGTYNIWHENGQQTVKGLVKDNMEDGKWTSWYSNGQKQYEKEYKKDELDGLSIEWYSNGQKKYEISYKAGQLSGTYNIWHENGQQTVKGSVKDNMEDGKWTSWYSNGQKQYEKKYANGKLDGLSVEWYSNGQNKSEISYKSGKKNGNWTYWDSNGKKEQEIEYAGGKIVSLIQNGKKLDFGKVTDIDGNVYSTIKIGNQMWMAENLKVIHYRNGYPIPNVTNNSKWENLKTGAYCNYDNSSRNASIYGSLYNWYTVNDKRGLAPEGWHIPSGKEWSELENYLGSNAGGKLKERGVGYWEEPNGGATNSSGFSALPGGVRDISSGSFSSVGDYGSWWSFTEGGTGGAWSLSLGYNGSGMDSNYAGKQSGFSVRCIRD